MLMFARREVVRPRVVDVNDVVFDIHRLLRRLIGEDVELFIMPSRGRGTVCIDSGQFQQVIINLAVNARDAMPHGGRLTIQIASAEEQANYEGGDACVSIAVTDTGIGMSDETQCHLFEPFFTTKDPGRGTGLGLATCYGVVQEAGGRIAVTSRLGEGSTFTIYLPLDESVAEEAPPPDDAGYLPGGSETVLLVEDEEAVRDLAAFVLGEQGYTVLTAADGDEAMTVARRHPGRIALLLSDVVMPRMGGSELARCLRAREPSLHVLLMSGYTDEEHVGAFSQGEFPFIAKPFSPLALLRRVRDILDGHERTPSANDAPAEEFTPAAAHVDGVPHAAHG
jgi:CheY-like chemotaxis protein